MKNFHEETGGALYIFSALVVELARLLLSGGRSRRDCKPDLLSRPG